MAGEAGTEAAKGSCPSVPTSITRMNRMDKPKMLGYHLSREQMPTIWTEAGLDFIIYTNDHSPAHVHVWKAGDEAIINLGSAYTLPSVRTIYRMKTRDVGTALGVVTREQKRFLKKWSEIHGGG
jgi:hypothetical protein